MTDDDWLFSTLSRQFDDCIRPKLMPLPADEKQAGTFLLSECADAQLRRQSPPAPSLPDKAAGSLNTAITKMPPTPLGIALMPYLTKLGWYQIYDSPTIDSTLASGLFASHLIGARGPLMSDTIYMGLFLLAPHTHYPLHQHPATEIYHILSGSIDISHSRTAPPRTYQPGSISVTPSMRVHQLQTSDEPCLILYLWGGDLSSYNWWWHCDESGQWQRTEWQRRSDSSWKACDAEILSDTEMRAAERN